MSGDDRLSYITKRIAAKVYVHMKMNSIKQKDFCKKLGISQAYMSQIITGRRPLTLKMIVRLEKELNIKLLEVIYQPVSI